MKRVPWFALRTCDATRQALPKPVLPKRQKSQGYHEPAYPYKFVKERF